MMKQKDSRKYYHISTVARIYDVHPQTLRLYEREGLLKPSRSRGNTRLYSDEDLRQLEIILNLSRDLGVNLAGIEVVLNMRSKMERIEADIERFLEYVHQEFYEGRDEEFKSRTKSLVRISPGRMIRVVRTEIEGEDDKYGN